MQIKLDNLRFLSQHGWHEEETSMGSEFNVSVNILFNSPAKIDTLSDTIDYVLVYEAIKKRMILPHKLLETLAVNLADDISFLDKRITRVEVNINKINPPIKNFSGNVGVGFVKDLT